MPPLCPLLSLLTIPLVMCLALWLPQFPAPAPGPGDVPGRVAGSTLLITERPRNAPTGPNDVYLPHTGDRELRMA